MSILTLVDILCGLITAGLRQSEAVAAIAATYQKARTEGRDVTPEELAAAERAREDALATWERVR
jgi:hypothetical protein